MKVNAQDLTATRLCRAEQCPHDAENYSRLCAACERKEASGRSIPTHVTPSPSTTLSCNDCGRSKPDKDFAIAVRLTKRRGRHYFCKKCVQRRLIEAEKRQRERQIICKREQRARRKAQGLTINGTPRIYRTSA